MLTGRARSLFRKKLLRWFAQSQRDLPWRRTSDPYRIWLSEIMLQQTRVAAAVPYYEKFVKHFPNVRGLAEAPEEEVLRLWSGLGYYSRARNLHKAAKQIVAKHNSRFPEDVDEALGLAGIGRYTAAAILSIAYGKKLAVLDGNVARVLARLGAIRGDLRSGTRWRELQTTADALLAARAPGEWNQAMMELGATICTPRSPLCLLCPVREFCEARKKGLADVIPAKRRKRAEEEITLAALVPVDERGRTLLLPPPRVGDPIALRGPHMQRRHVGHPPDVTVLLSRLWHFPTIRVSDPPSKTDRGAPWGVEAELRDLARELFGRHVNGRLTLVERVRHAVTYRRITVHPFRWEVDKLPTISHSKVVPLSDLSSLPVSNLTRKVARAVLGAASH